jgi:shikimate dehydrogenase
MNIVDRYVLFGHPIAHTRSPHIHAMFARQCRQSLTYEAVDVLPDRFIEVARQFFASGGRGANVTVPYKQAALALTSDLTPRARRAGSLNTLAALPTGGLLGDNTDGIGLVRDLAGRMKLALAGQRILLLGAGGAARGVIEPLLGLRPAALLLANRTSARLEDIRGVFAPLAASLDVRFGAVDDERGRGGFDLIINATSASHAGELPPMPLNAVHPGTVCYDMVYGQDGTAFTRWALEQGARRAEMGLGMLVEQAAEAFHIWRGVLPDTAPVLADIGAH